MKTLIFILIAIWFLFSDFNPLAHWNGVELSLWLVDESWVALEFFGLLVVGIVAVLGIALFALGIFAALGLGLAVSVVLLLIGGGLLSWPFLLLLVLGAFLMGRRTQETC